MRVPDTIHYPETSARYKPHPEGQYAAVCVDSIDLGERVEQYQGNPARVVPKCAVVFHTGEVNDETGEPFEVHGEFTISTFETSGLRKFLEAWRGKSYADENEMREKGQLHKLVGHGALITVEHKKSGTGRTYAKIKGIAPLPKALPKPDVGRYQRPKFWEDRKAAYATEVAKLRGEPQPVSGDDFEPAGDDSDLPF